MAEPVKATCIFSLLVMLHCLSNKHACKFLRQAAGARESRAFQVGLGSVGQHVHLSVNAGPKLYTNPSKSAGRRGIAYN
jgi:hypothetical protein